MSGTYFKIKLIKVENFIDRIPLEKVILERDMKQYNGTVGLILTHYAKADKELMKEFPDFHEYYRLIDEANNMINNLTMVRTIDQIRKDVIE